MESPVLPVSELNRRVREMLESSIPLMWVSGEICNFTCAASGHWYFSLKDLNAQVRCVMFRHKRLNLDWQPKNGMQVEARVLVTLYEARGDFQLTIENIRQAGLGLLYERFERLKKILAAEGLFDEGRKKAIPSFPKVVGIITSTAGAALHDVITTMSRRNPLINVIVYPVPVQGEGAAAQIATAINLANFRNECDVLILCRGGGSYEDLWQFNEEIVARAIFKSLIPIVAGVGHETDVTLADFVADRRAPTPTGAAELVSPDLQEIKRQFIQLKIRLNGLSYRFLEKQMQRVDHLSRRLIHPRQKMAVQVKHLMQIQKRLTNSMATSFKTWQQEIKNITLRFRSSKPDLSPLFSLTRQFKLDLNIKIQRLIERNESGLLNLQHRLKALHPIHVLERGYSVVFSEDGQVVRNTEDVNEDENLQIQFSKNALSVKVVNKQVDNFKLLKIKD